MILKFTDLFNVLKESDNSKSPNLTEERIYSLCQDLNKIERKIPVFSGAIKNKGVVGFVPFYENEIENKNEFVNYSKKHKINYYKNNSECITIVADGNAGNMTFRHKENFPIFCMNISCIAIFTKEEKEIKIINKEYDGLNLKWFFLKFYNYFRNIINGEGVQHFTKNIYKKIELNIPKYKEQMVELNFLEKIENINNNLTLILEKIYSFEEKFFSIEKTEILEEKPLNYYLKHVSRNDALSKQGIYLRSRNLGHGKIIHVLSGSVKKFYGIIPEEKNIHMIFDRPCLHVVTRGKSGKIKFLKKGNYATNTNAMLIKINNKKFKDLGINSQNDEEIYLKFLKIFLEPLFIDYCSSADLSVFPLTEVMKKLIVSLPKLNNNIKVIVSKYDSLMNYSVIFEKIKEKSESLFEKEIIMN